HDPLPIFQRLERVLERVWVGDEVFAVAVGATAGESRFTAFDRREAVGLVDGDHAQPGEDRVAIGLGSQQDRPGALAGVLDQFARGVDGVRDGALEVAVVASVELGFVAAGWTRGLGRGLHEPRPGRGRPAIAGARGRSAGRGAG